MRDTENSKELIKGGLSGLPRWLKVAFLAVFINWVCFIWVSLKIGGDAIGVHPSEDGFVVFYHGAKTAITEPVWVFSLFYSAATLLLSPLVVFIVLWKQRKEFKFSWYVIPFICLWAIGWFGSISASFFSSLSDWWTGG